MSETISIDVWSDVSCPWCYIGKRRMESGIAQFNQKFPDVEVVITGHSYELAPETPEDFVGTEADFLAKYKGMPLERVNEMLEQIGNLGVADGVTFNWDTQQHSNTHKAHRVLQLAADQGLYAEMQDRLFRAYFTEGLHIGDVETLGELGEEVGMDADEIRDAVEAESFEEEIERDIVRARMLGVNGVPYYLFDEKYGVSGAQSSDTFANVLEQVLEFQRTGTEPE